VLTGYAKGSLVPLRRPALMLMRCRSRPPRFDGSSVIWVSCSSYLENSPSNGRVPAGAATPAAASLRSRFSCCVRDESG
jgi:hypothetical protein